MTSRPIFVLGMHRSGTSALAGALRLLGLYLGPDDAFFGPHETNPKGFWELVSLVTINDEILKALGRDWSTATPMPRGWEEEPGVVRWRMDAQARIRQTFDGHSVWGFKDPRTCLTFPFWKAVISDPISCILCVRNPLNVARSLHRRNGFPLELGASLWAMHLGYALAHSNGLRRIVLFYDELVEDSEPQLRRLARFVGIEVTADALSRSRAFLDASIRHHVSAGADVLAHSELPSSVKQQYFNLLELAKNAD